MNNGNYAPLDNLEKQGRVKPFLGISSNLSCKYFKQKLPKSHSSVWWLVFDGDVENTVDARFLRWRIEEIEEIDYSDAVIDVSQVSGKSENFDTLIAFASKHWKRASGPVFLVDDKHAKLFSDFTAQENIATSKNDAFSKIVWRNRKRQFDGGKSLILPWVEKLPEIKQVNFSLDNLSDIKCSCFETDLENKKIGFISFDGVYRYGSSGANDAFFISHKLRQFYEVLQPFALMIDCTKLDYEWGDEFSLELRTDDYSSLLDSNGNMRIKVIAPHEKKEKLRYGISEKFMVESLKDAFKSINVEF